MTHHWASLKVIILTLNAALCMENRRFIPQIFVLI
jgi:hypothetical protein